MARTLVRARTLLTQSTNQAAIDRGGAIIEDGLIQHVGALEELESQGPFEAIIGDLERHIALPGFVNGHHHSLRPARIGLRSSPLETWLVRQRERVIPPLSLEEVYDHTLWGTLQFLKSGVTAVVDHYPADPRVEDLGVPTSVQAYLDAGVRAAVCLSCADQQRYVYDDDETFLSSLPTELADRLRAKLRPFDQEAFFTLWTRMAERYDGREGRIRIGFGPGGPQWCSDDLLRRLRRTADEHTSAPIQIHLVESKFQALYGYQRYGKSIVAHLDELGFFGPATSCAHCVWLSQADIALLADRGAVAVHNPSSNLALHSGVAPIADMLEGGVRVGFGLDAAGLNDSMDMLTDLRLALLLQRHPGWSKRQVTAADMLGAATHAGADALGMQVRLGRLEPGYAGDVVLVDRTRLYGSPYVSPLAPPEEVLLRRAEAADVDHVLVAGRPVIEAGKPVGIDEEALRRRVARSLERTYELLESADQLFEQLEPHVSSFFQRWEADSARLLPPNYQLNTR